MLLPLVRDFPSGEDRTVNNLDQNRRGSKTTLMWEITDGRRIEVGIEHVPVPNDIMLPVVA